LVILSLSVALKCWNLGHAQLTYWDESFHAVVARNLLKHPLTFTLYDKPWLGLPFTDWGSAHIWLHKPPLALWQIALSFALFGVNTFSLRLPSVLLSTAAAFLTYRISTELFQSKPFGVLAASLQAFNPFLMGSIHGYYFSDHIDVALLFWIEVGLYALVKGLRSGLARYYVLAGVGLGLATLTKAFPAMIVAGMAAGLWGVKRLAPGAMSRWHISGSHLLWMASAASLVVLPWVVYLFLAWPSELIWNVKLMLRHLTTNIEGWAAPWDRFLFDYLLHQVPWIYTMVLVALCVATVRSLRGNAGELFVALWAWGVLAPFSAADSKPPSSVLIALPALLLALTRLLQLAWAPGRTTQLALWAAVAVAMIVLPYGESLVLDRDGLSEAQRARFAPYLLANLFVVKQLATAAAVSAAVVVARRLMARDHDRRLRVAQLMLAAPVTLVLMGRYVEASGDVAFRKAETPSFQRMGTAMREQTPEHAAFIIDANSPSMDPGRDGYHLFLMFWSDRPVYHLQYQLKGKPLADVVARIRSAGGVPFLISDRPDIQAEPALAVSEHGFRIYPAPATPTGRGMAEVAGYAD
jgi:4-amino-4-deoxy-L-arabinose transferase